MLSAFAWPSMMRLTRASVLTARETDFVQAARALGLPAISWGLMISGAQTRILTAPHLLLFPGLFLSMVVLSILLIGDALRDALDPKLP